MPREGQLIISTRNVRLDAEYATLHPEVVSGEYSLIEVSDTGSGISPDVLNHVFELFYDQGTGQGVGAVHFGFICRAAYEVVPAEHAGTDPIEGGHESVLVVEDNVPLCRAAVRQLTALGYTIFEADNAAAALRVLCRAIPTGSIWHSRRRVCTPRFRSCSHLAFPTWDAPNSG